MKKELFEIKEHDLEDTFTTILLNLPHDIVKEISEKDPGPYKVEVSIQGVRVNSGVFFSVIKDVLDHYAKHIKETYDVSNIDKMIHEESEAKLKDEAYSTIQKLKELAEKLETIDDILVPYWEK
jgi:protein subunit release factor A